MLTNSNSYKDGDIIDINETVNGCRYFILYRQGNGWMARYVAVMQNPRNYEYDVNELMSGEDVAIVGNVYDKLGEWL